MAQSPSVRGRVLLTGGTGFVGGHLTRQLIRDGTPVRLLVRRPERVSEELRRLAELVPGDINDPSSLARAAEGVEAVIHLVGIISEGRGRSYPQVHVRGTENVLRACKQAGVARYLHMSALGAREGARTRYHRTKWQAEEAVRASGLDHTIFRPSIIFGEDDEFVNRLVGIVRKAPVIPVLGNGLGLLQPIWIEDVVSCFVQSLSNPETIGQAYEVGGAEAFGLVEIMEVIRRRLAPSKPIAHIPIWLVWPAAWAMRLLPDPLLTTEQLAMLQEDNVCEIAPVQRTFRLSWKRLETYLEELLGRRTLVSASTPAGH